MGGRDGAKGSGRDGDATAEAAAVQLCRQSKARETQLFNTRAQVLIPTAIAERVFDIV